MCIMFRVKSIIGIFNKILFWGGFSLHLHKMVCMARNFTRAVNFQRFIETRLCWQQYIVLAEWVKTQNLGEAYNGNKIIHKLHDKSLGRYRKLIQTKAKPLGHIENNCKLYSVTKPDSSYSPLPPVPGCSFCCTDDQKPKIWLGVPNLVPRSHSLLHWKARGRCGYEIRACHITTVYMQRVLTIWLKNPVEVSKT